MTGNKKIFQIVLVIFVVLIGTSPYFVLGNDSAIGLYDEIDLPIPSMLLKQQYGLGYNTIIAGGSLLQLNFLPLNQFLSLYELLNNVAAPYVAAYMFRFLAYILMVYAAYIFIQRDKESAARQGERWIAICFATLMPFSMFVFYGWILGGYGLLFPLLYLSSHMASTARITLSNMAYACVVAIVAANSYGGGYIYLLIFPLLSALYWFEIRGNKFKEYFVFAFLIMLVFVFSDVFELESLYRLYRSDSARVSGFVSLQGNIAVKTTFVGKANELIQQAYESFFSHRDSYALFFLIPLGIFFGGKKIALRYLLIGISALIYCYVIKVASENFRGDQVFAFLCPFVFLVAAKCVVRNLNTVAYGKRIISKAIILVMCLFVLQQHFRNMKWSVDEIATGNTWSSYESYKSALANRYNFNYRSFVLTPYKPRPEFLQVAGLRTIDGMRPTFSKYRTTFWFGVLPESIGERFHTHRQTSMGLSGHPFDIRYEALAMANVRYLISSSEINGGYKIDLSGGLCSREKYICNAYLEIFGYSIDQLLQSKSLFIKELDSVWDYVYIPKKISISSYPELSVDYLKEIRETKKHTVVLASRNKLYEGYYCSNCESGSLNYKIGLSGVSISGAKGIKSLVINEEYNDSMIAKCLSANDENIKLVRANLIQTLVVLENSCDSLRVDFN